MAEFISIHVGKDKYRFPQDRDRINEKVNVFPSPEGPSVRKVSDLEKALRLTQGVASIQRQLHMMFGDIQHELFRLGKLGGLKGDAYQAYADQIGDSVREAKSRLMVGVLVHNIPLFAKDEEANYMNVLEPLPTSRLVTEIGMEDIRFLDEGLHVDWNCAHHEKHADAGDRPAFPQYDEEDKGIGCINWLGTLDTFFHPVLAASGQGSLYDRLIEIAKFAFCDDENDKFMNYGDAQVKYFNPFGESRAEVYLDKATNIVFKALAGTVGAWATLGIIEKCAHCVKDRPEGNQIQIFPDEFTRRACIDGKVCPVCYGFGMKFTPRIRTTRPGGGQGTALPQSYPVTFLD